MELAIFFIVGTRILLLSRNTYQAGTRCFRSISPTTLNVFLESKLNVLNAGDLNIIYF